MDGNDQGEFLFPNFGRWDNSDYIDGEEEEKMSFALHNCKKINDLIYCNGECDKCEIYTTQDSGTTLDKCQWPKGVSVKPDGINELDPCIYEEVEVVYNCTVRLLRCKYCGHEEWEWEREREGE